MRTVIIAALAVALVAVACGGDGGAPPPTGGPNFVDNPSAEENTDGYIGHNGATISQDTSTASGGRASIKVGVPDVQGAGVQVWKADGLTMISVSPGLAYMFSADVRGDIGKTVRLEMLWHRADGAFSGTSLGPITVLPVDTFVGMTFTAVAPEDAALVTPQIVTDAAPGAPLVMWVDNVHFEQASVTPTSAPTGSPTP